MNQLTKKPWSIKQSEDLYGIDRWGNGYFGLSEDGNVTLTNSESSTPILEIIKGMKDRDLQMPVLLRVENILDAQIKRLNDAFSQAIEKLEQAQAAYQQAQQCCSEQVAKRKAQWQADPGHGNQPNACGRRQNHNHRRFGRWSEPYW